MKKYLLILFVLMISLYGFSQSTYPIRADTVLMQKVGGTTFLKVVGKGSFSDTLFLNKLKLPTGTNGYVLTSDVNGNLSLQASSGGGGTNFNIGTGNRLAVFGTNNLKTLFNDITGRWDSTSNPNGLTYKADTNFVATRLKLYQVIDSSLAAFSGGWALSGTTTLTGDVFIDGSVSGHTINMFSHDGSNNGFFAISPVSDNTNIGWSNDASTDGGAFTFGTDAIYESFGTGTLKYAADYSANYTSRSLVDSGFVGSIIRGDSLLKVTQRGNTTDSILFRGVNVSSIADSILALGNSIILGLSTPTNDSIFIRRLSYIYNYLPIDFEAVAGRGAFRAIMNANSVENPGSKKLLAIMVGINDIRKGGNNQKTYQKIIQGVKSVFQNHNLSSYTGASAISNAGTWFTFDCTQAGVGGKSIGKGTATINDSTWTTVTGTSVAISIIGSDGTRYSYSTSFKIYIDGTLRGTYSSNLQTDLINDNDFDNGRIPLSFMYNGLAYGSHRVTVVNSAADTLIVDYIGRLKYKGDCTPMLLWDIAYLNSTGYASIQPPFTANGTIDSINAKFDSLSAVLSTYGPIYHAKTNNYFNPATGLVADGVHHNDVGEKADADAMLALLPHLESGLPNNGTILYNEGFYGVQNNMLNRFAYATDLAVPGTGITVSGNVWNVNLSTGVSGGQSAIGGTGAGENLTLSSTTNGTKGDIRFGSASYIFRESTGKFGINNGTPSAQMDIISDATNTLPLSIKAFAGQTGNLLAIFDNSANPLFRVSGTGGARISGDFASPTGGQAWEIIVNSGYSYLQSYDRNSNTYSPARITGNPIEFLANGSSTLNLTANNSQFGTTYPITISSSNNNFGEMSGPAVIAGGGQDMSIYPGSTSGARVIFGTYNGVDWKSILEYANQTGGAATQLLVGKTQGVMGIGVSSVNASALLELASTTRGFLPPRMTATQGSALTAAEGLLIYVTNTNGTFTAKGWWGWDGAAWQKLNN